MTLTTYTKLKAEKGACHEVRVQLETWKYDGILSELDSYRDKPLTGTTGAHWY